MSLPKKDTTYFSLGEPNEFMESVNDVDLFRVMRGSLVTLVVDRPFLPQNVGPMVGTYEGPLLVCECRWGGDCTCRWWGHLNTTCHNQTCLTFLH